MKFAGLFVVLACVSQASAAPKEETAHGVLTESMYCGNITCYEILGITREASPRAIKKSYRKLSMTWHPDRNKGDDAKQRFTEIATAYETLSDEEVREDYDYYLDHPEERLFNQYKYYYRHAPKSDWRLVVFGFVVVSSCIQYASAVQRYKYAHKSLRGNPRVLGRARQIANDRLRTSAAAARGKAAKRARSKPSREEMEAAIDEVLATSIDIRGGFGEPSVKHTLAAWIVLAPYRITRWLCSQGRWYMLYTVLKKPYDEDARLHLTQSILGMRDGQWQDFSEEEREALLAREIWVPANKKAYDQEQLEKFQQKNTAKYKRYVRHKKRQ